MSASSTPRRRPQYPASLANLHRFRKTTHGHDGSSRIVMVRKTDQRTFASIKKGQEPKLETVTRETIETFRGQRTEIKFTTEKTDCDNDCPPDVLKAVLQHNKKTILKKKNPKMDFSLECLKVHNEYRRKHGVPPLKLDKEMCKVSQQWADILIRRSAPQHSNNRDYGENIYSCQSTNPNFNISAREVVETWYSEMKHHAFGDEPKDLKSGHFTQVVWKDSKYLGVGFAKSAGKIIVVTNYDPPGNFVGQFAENVPCILAPTTPISPENNNTYSIENKMSSLSLKYTTRKGVADNFEIDFLNKHNEFRQLHGVPPLKLDRKLCKYSETWAVYLANKHVLQHRPESNYGENIFSVSFNDPKFCIRGEDPVIHWYNDMNDYPFGKEPKNLKKGGHFTQVIWKSSEYLGVGVAKNNNEIFVVANYSPAGNFVGDYVNNVPPPLKARENGHISSPELPKQRLENGLTVLNGSEGNFKEDFLEAHNNYRKIHGAEPLILDEDICKHSQAWADHLASSDILEHNPMAIYGENVYALSSSDPSFTITGFNPVDIWYEEVKLHDFSKEPTDNHSLHFSQVVWKSSRKLGVGVAKSTDGTIYVVANYSPPGNYEGEYRLNVEMAKPNRNDMPVGFNKAAFTPPDPGSEAPSAPGSPQGVTPKPNRNDMPVGMNSQAWTPPGEDDSAEVKPKKPPGPRKPENVGKTGQSGGIDTEKFASEALKVHNDYRKKHGVPDLVLNKEMCAFAQEWAETLAKKASLTHRANNKYGENIFSMYSSDFSHTPSARDVVKEWYDEVKSYTNYTTESVNQKALHFTQVVWQGSKELGIGIAKNQKGQTYVVANYNPPGNMGGKFVKNVIKPKS